jgi:hypothetical protein
MHGNPLLARIRTVDANHLKTCKEVNPMTQTTTPLKFTGFSTERCIRILRDGEAPALFPVDSRQVEAVLALAADADSLRRQHLYLIETETPDGETFVMVDHCDGEVYLQADAGMDMDCAISTGEFAGVCWRVLGFVEGSKDTSVELAVGSARSASEICEGLRMLLEPTRVAVAMHGGTVEATVANRPAEVILLEGAPDDVAAAKKDGLALVTDAQGGTIAAEYVVTRSRADIDTHKTGLYWSQLAY